MRLIKILYFSTSKKWVFFSTIDYASALILVFLLIINISNFMFDNFFLSIVSFYTFSFLL